MNPVYPPQRPAAGVPSAADLMRRRPQRLTATVPWGLYQRLQAQADMEGRSLSGLVAYLLEHNTAPG